MIISLNLPDLLPEGTMQQLATALKQELVSNIANQARAKWIKLAGGLQSSRRDYIAAIQEVEVQDGRASVALVGEVANLIENGQAGYDMHDTLLGQGVPVVPRGKRGKHAKKDGSGFYRAIPFRHGTPGTTGAVGAAMGSQYAGHEGVAGFAPTNAPGFAFQAGQSALLGQNVYDQAKKLKSTKGMPNGKVAYGGRLQAGLAPKLKEHHATDIYAGMIKSSKTYEKATQSQYTTFRTISTGSPGWMRGATEGKHYAQDVQRFVAGVAPKAVADFIKGLSK